MYNNINLPETNAIYHKSNVSSGNQRCEQNLTLAIKESKVLLLKPYI